MIRRISSSDDGHLGAEPGEQLRGRRRTGARLGGLEPEPDAGQRRTETVVELLPQPSTLGLGGLEDPVALGAQGVAEPRGVDDRRDQRDDGVEELPVGAPERRLPATGAEPAARRGPLRRTSSGMPRLAGRLTPRSPATSPAGSTISAPSSGSDSARLASDREEQPVGEGALPIEEPSL